MGCRGLGLEVWRFGASGVEFRFFGFGGFEVLDVESSAWGLRHMAGHWWK